MMKRKQRQSNFEHGRATKIGILVCNLGTPDAPNPRAVRRFLREFLSDVRVVELPRLLWLPILHGVVLRLRPRRSAAAYTKIWREDGSPLMAISLRQGAALRSAMEAKLPGRTAVEVAMRYGNPSISTGLRKLREMNARKIFILPLYPQYAGSSTGSVFDAVSAELGRWRWVPTIRFLTDYHADELYIGALAKSVQTYWATHGRGNHLLISFHGTPKASLLHGDPYHCQCQATARLLAERLKISESDWSTGFQSRFGWNEWLQPYTTDRLRKLGGEGLKRVDVVCPGFAVDCLETLEEIELQYDKEFIKAGGGSLRYIPALNDSPDHIEMLTSLTLRNIAGWNEAEPNWDASLDKSKREAVKTRADRMKNDLSGQNP